ncbi:MAG TPA: ABC transporter ATP-binding protein [Acidimicrobiales bacterium]
MGKRFTKYEDTPMLVTRALHLGPRTRRSALWALRDVDLDVAPGESVGVIGRNGSGKSTLLQLMAGVTAPTEGRVAVHGRVAPLISVGVGFHPELTGRENVYVNGTILGLTRSEIERRFEAIVAFAELEEFIDTPVKFYSSGMYVRLGFAVAAQSEPDVLVVDEVLAVGDLAFQLKCYKRMSEVQNSGATIVVVSHNLASVRTLCQRALVVHDGRVRFDGSTDDALSVYHNYLAETAVEEVTGASGTEAKPAARAAVESFELLDADGQAVTHVSSDSVVTFRVRICFDTAARDPVLGLSIVNEAGIPVYADNAPVRAATGNFAPGDDLSCDIEVALPLPTGTYQAVVGATDSDLATAIARTRPLFFYVSGRRMVHGVVDLHASFTVNRDLVSADGLRRAIED